MNGSRLALRLLDLLRLTALLAAGLAMVTLIATFGWLVYGRYILNATPTWVEQLSLLLIVVITFLGAAVGVAERSHLSVDFVIDLVSARTRLVLCTVADLLMLAFGILMAVHASRLASLAWSTKIPLLNIPEGFRSVPAVLCGVLVALFSLAHIALRLSGYRSGRPEASRNLGVE